MKITRNTNKAQLKALLQNNFVAVKKADKALADSITYASEQEKKDPKAVKKADLVDLVQQVATLLGDKFNEAMTPAPVVAVENSVKPAAKLSKSKKADDKAEDTKSTPASKKPSAKDTLVTTLTENGEVVVTSFKDKFTLNGETFEKMPNINTMADLRNAFASDEDVYLVFYWTSRHIKQYGYFGGLLDTPKSFPMDVDICPLLYVSDEDKVAYALSTYTEAFYTILPEMLEEVNGVRFSMGAEFQIYLLVK